MKTVILAGGLGYRLSEEDSRVPKPLTSIGDIPIIEHIMNIYDHYDYKDFIICLGYKGNLIKNYFLDYYDNNSNLSIDLKNNIKRQLINNKKEWIVDLVDTGQNTATGSRLKKIQNYVQDKTFFLTYGDGLADINITELLKFHRDHKKLVTITTMQPKGQFGVIEIDENQNVIAFQEKPYHSDTLVNIGFMVVEPKVFDYISRDKNDVWWEADVLPELVKLNEVKAYIHQGSFKCLDSPKDKIDLEEIWNKGNAFWKVN